MEDEKKYRVVISATVDISAIDEDRAVDSAIQFIKDDYYVNLKRKSVERLD